MSYPTWPVSLPKPLRDGFSATTTPAVRAIQMESGPDRLVRTSSRNMHFNQHSIACDEQQAAEFDSFYDNEAGAGTNWVVIPMLTSNKLVPHLCRIRGDITRVPFGGKLRISFQLETDEQHIDWGV